MVFLRGQRTVKVDLNGSEFFLMFYKTDWLRFGPVMGAEKKDY